MKEVKCDSNALSLSADRMDPAVKPRDDNAAPRDDNAAPRDGNATARDDNSPLENKKKKIIKEKLLANEALSRYTTWRTGGQVQRLYVPSHVDALAQFLKTLPKEEPLYFLGLGSNTLVLDETINGTVILSQGSGLNHINRLDDVTIYAEAGVACGQFARFAARLGLVGAEFMAGIPGTIGGALAMNAGCYGEETWNFVTHVNTLNMNGEAFVRYPSDCEVGYRYAKTPTKEYFTGAFFRLTQGDSKASLQKIKDLLAQRNASQPTNFPNCGSVFRNPQDDYAARLIESCGLKGYRLGGAQVSEKHANFIVNHGDATSLDILNLIFYVQKTVKDKTGTELIREVKILGEDQELPG